MGSSNSFDFLQYQTLSVRLGKPLPLIQETIKLGSLSNNTRQQTNVIPLTFSLPSLHSEQMYFISATSTTSESQGHQSLRNVLASLYRILLKEAGVGVKKKKSVLQLSIYLPTYICGNQLCSHNHVTWVVQLHFFPLFKYKQFQMIE